MGLTKTLLASPDLGNAVFLSLLRLEFDAAGSHHLETDDQEHVINVLSGTCTIHIDLPDGKRMSMNPVGRREDIFGGKPEMIYVPIGCRYEIVCNQHPFDAVIYMAPTDEYAPPAHVKPEQVRTVNSGKLDWQRDVYIGMGEDGPATRMILGETESPAGNWSGFPPHRHTMSDLPNEAKLEEMYFFNFDRDTGFIIGGIYDEPGKKEEARLKLFRHGQVFDVPKGYHFLAPCPGYRVRYTWALGGKQKVFGAWREDDELAWLHNS